MSRSGYCDDFEDVLQFGRWRGIVASTIRGNRGHTFLKEMLAALDAMPEKRLVADVLEANGEVCAIGAVGKARGIDMSKLDADDYDSVAAAFDIASPLAQEIVFMNDEAYWGATPEERFEKMRAWVVASIAEGEAARQKSKKPRRPRSVGLPL